MLKKAGIVAAAGAASLVAVSPLAFAGEQAEGSVESSGSHHSSKSEFQAGHDGGNVVDKSGSGLVNVSGNHVALSPQACGTAFNGNSLVQGALGGFGEAENSSGVTSDSSVACSNAPVNGDEITQIVEGGDGGDSDSKGTK